MRVFRTNNGRRVEFNTPYGSGHAEWDAEGLLVSESITIREPQASPAGPAQGTGGCGGRPITLVRKLKGAVGLAKAESGVDRASHHVMANRKRACLMCEHFDFCRCDLCGCHLAAKVMIAKETCPDGRW